ncbi:glycosyltransferase [Propionivibrio sp.]|uniref:glycosyltransferase n=1 Tax=Propionivibrio sp. TaxID=2212460 RepID=UPI0039E689CA
MIAYHFPPLAGSSGIQRTLRFAQHLPKFGWEPLVLTAHPRAYERTSDDLMADVPPGVIVRRAFALDTARHLSVGGRYMAAMARPDRWMSWKFGAVREGMRMIREFAPQAIWSTYPIATAHAIGAALQKRSGLPWIADFRDPMVQDGYPADPLVRKSFQQIEKETFSSASASTFTTPSAARTYRERFPASAGSIEVLENGYDEETFAQVEAAAGLPAGDRAREVVLLHSGIVYPSERDPTQLFEALGQLGSSGRIAPGMLKIRFRAAVHDGFLRDLAARYGVNKFIECLPPIPYREALSEMLAADGLLVMQASNCNEQIPAKIYEYLRSKRPILALTDPHGDTAAVLRQAGIADIVRLDSVSEIQERLPSFTETIRQNSYTLPSQQAVKSASREGRTAQLAGLLDSLMAGRNRTAGTGG